MPAPTATAVPFPTFTATTVPPTPTPITQAAPTLMPPPPPAVPTPPPPSHSFSRQVLSLSLPAQLPAPLYYLNETGQIWRVVGAPPDYSLEQVTQEAAPITDFAISPAHGRLAYVTNDYRDLIEFDPTTQQRVVTNTNAPWLAIHLCRFALCLLLVGALCGRLFNILAEQRLEAQQQDGPSKAS